MSIIMTRLIPVTLVIFYYMCCCCHGAITGTRYYMPNRGLALQTPPSRDITDLKRQILILEREVTVIRHDNTVLRTTLEDMNRTMDTLIRQLPALINLNAANENAKMEELTSRVDAVEKNIDIIADQEGIEMTETELSRFLGNTEAQLVDIQMDPDFEISDIPTMSPEDLDDITVAEMDLLGGALYVINQQNEQLSSQMATLRQEVSEGGDSPVSGQSETVLIQNRLNQLERIAMSQGTAKKGSSISSFRGLGQAASGINNQGVSTDALSDDEQDAFQGILQDVRGGAVSLFSVARTGSMRGVNHKPLAVPYETQLALKGGVYDNTNGTFTCNVAGYYFITFTARTFDHKYLGVNLMKNDDSLTAIFSDKHGRNVMQTQSIIVHLAVSDRLWIRMPPSNMFAIHSDQYHLTTFTGFLVYPGDP